MTKPLELVVRIAYDDAAGVWYVEHSDVEGLHVEAKTLDEMRAKLSDSLRDLIIEIAVDD